MGYEIIENDGFKTYINECGKKISSASKGVIIEDGMVFRNISATGELLPYEDWRLANEDRARDLLGRMSIDEMIGLMAHTESQSIPAAAGQMLNVGTYGGKQFGESDGAEASDLTDQQHAMIDDGIRNICISRIKDLKTVVGWVNNAQREAEKRKFGIPINISTDPRNGSGESGVEFKNDAGMVSHWPEGWGLAAIDDVEVASQYGEIISKEYRAMGITTALGPQIDLGSEPRWLRISGTLGSDVEKNIELTRAVCDAMQTTEGSSDGWGDDSVVAMVKHWPGGGTGEGGRDAHYPFGKYAVYPGGNFDTHLRPFTEGAFNLPGKTRKAAAVMPYYTVSWDQDVRNHRNVGNSFSSYIIKDLLIDRYGYDGLICTDWDVLSDKRPHVGMYVMGGKCYGVEDISRAERALRLIVNGVNQIGGLSDRTVIDEAVEIGKERYGAEYIEEKIRISAYKMLLILFRLGLFDNPYVDIAQSERTVGCESFVESGKAAQAKSVVVLKRKTRFPLHKGMKLYVPEYEERSHYSFVRLKTEDRTVDPLQGIDYKRYFTRVDSPEDADAALIFMTTPVGRNGYEFDMMKLKSAEPQQEAGYYPISLQYRPYTAVNARSESIAGGDPNEDSVNRTYRGRTEVSANESQLDNVIAARRDMGDRPVIAVLHQSKPTIPGEFEPYCDCIVTEFGIDGDVLMEILFGEREARGVLPCIMPADMETVEAHSEDLTGDIIPYRDSEGNVYGIGFGLRE